MKEKFWMVWCQNRDSPKKKHKSRECAEIEAKRLCEQGNDHFYVLEGISVTYPAQTITEELQDYPRF